MMFIPVFRNKLLLSNLGKTLALYIIKVNREVHFFTKNSIPEKPECC